MRQHIYRAILTAALLPPGPVQATGHWLLLAEHEKGDIFIDAVHTVPSPVVVKAWTLLSFRSVQERGALSEKRLLLYFCSNGSLEWQQSIYYAGPMAEGEILGSEVLSKLNPQGKRPWPEETLKDIFRRLC